jgi:hypothetical protein
MNERIEESKHGWLQVLLYGLNQINKGNLILDVNRRLSKPWNAKPIQQYKVSTCGFQSIFGQQT